MTDRPPFGTAPIRCGKTRCKWRGYETGLSSKPGKYGITHKVCPACGCDSYLFMTPKEIQAWERSKQQAAAEPPPTTKILPPGASAERSSEGTACQ